MHEAANGPARRSSLLEIVQGLLERTYRMRTGVEDPGRFVIGDRGYRRLYGLARPAESLHSEAWEGARTMVRETDEGLRACIYYPDTLIRQLERRPPQMGLCDDNVDPFAALVEELDHLLLIAERTARHQEVSLFELELHANVSKHFVLERFLAGRSKRLSERRRRWLRHHLFEKHEFCDANPDVRARYREAVRWAVRFIDALRGLGRDERIGSLREFHHAPAGIKLRMISALG
jgi:hypothetical protein